MRTFPCLMVLAALALPAAAPAQMGTSKSGIAARAEFNRLDSNGDGGLTANEMLSRGREKGGEAVFALLDGDGDGRLSLKEFSGAPSGAMIGRFDAYDADKNGFVTRKEFPAKLDPLLMTALDRDGDGKVALAEIRPAFAGTRTARAQTAPPTRKTPAAPERQPAGCWVTGFGDNKWIIEGPVTFDGCR